MIVVSDSGPIIHLARVEHLDLLPHLFGRVLVPDAVFEEVVGQGEGRVGAAELAAARWVEVVEAPPEARHPTLDLAGLDPGEHDAILLAVERRVDLLLCDDLRGRKRARQAGLAIAGTLGVIGIAKARGAIPAAAPLIRAVLEGGLRASPAVVATVLRRVGEPHWDAG